MKAWMLAAVVLVACSDAPAPAPEPDEPAVESNEPQAYSQRTVFYMEATNDQITAKRDSMPEPDFLILADDLMFYRASAHEFLEQHALPVKRIDGRQPIRLMVYGTPKDFDFDYIETLDLIVLYDANREPRAIAPNEVDAALEYFQLSDKDTKTN